MAALVLLHQRDVGVLETGAAHLEVGDLLAVLGEPFAGETCGVGRRMDELLTTPAPPHLALAGDLPGEFVRAAVGDDPAGREDQDAVGELLGFAEVVRREQDRGLFQFGEPIDEVVELPPGVRVEAGSRLVEEQQLRPADDADGDVETAALSTGERQDLLVRLLAEADHLDQLVHIVRTPAFGGGVGRVVLIVFFTPAGVMETMRREEPLSSRWCPRSEVGDGRFGESNLEVPVHLRTGRCVFSCPEIVPESASWRGLPSRAAS
jgi:hypothetical protein